MLALSENCSIICFGTGAITFNRQMPFTVSKRKGKEMYQYMADIIV